MMSLHVKPAEKSSEITDLIVVLNISQLGTSYRNAVNNEHG